MKSKLENFNLVKLNLQEMAKIQGGADPVNINSIARSAYKFGLTVVNGLVRLL